MALDRDQPADDGESWPVREGTGRRAGDDPVVDDLEARLVEPLALGEVAGEPGGDGDVQLGETGSRSGPPPRRGGRRGTG